LQNKRTGDLKLIQELNRSIILNMIREFGPISRSEIAKRNKLSPTTVTSAVNELILTGFVYEDGTGSSNGGRKPIMVRFSPDNYFLIGVSISNFSITIAEINLEATIRRNKKIYAKEGFFLKEDVIAFTMDLIAEFIEECPDMETCIGISIIIPGIVDSARGVIYYNSKLGLENVYLKDLVQDRFKMKTWIENDMNAIVLAEKKFGKFGKFQNLLYISIGGGVGSGVVVNDFILRGSRGGAAEFGHTSVDIAGARCECGNRGCLENYISWPAIRSRIVTIAEDTKRTKLVERIRGNASEVSPTDFYNALKDGDSIANAVMEETVAYLGIGIVNLVNLFNPDVIILGGDMLCENEMLLDKMKDYVKQHGLGFSTEGLQICPSSLGGNAELIGAASVLLRDVFGFSLSS
jgi:predicted NBD/HSP70 family sugar kinase